MCNIALGKFNHKHDKKITYSISKHDELLLLLLVVVVAVVIVVVVYN